MSDRALAALQLLELLLAPEDNYFPITTHPAHFCPYTTVNVKENVLKSFYCHCMGLMDRTQVREVNVFY